MCLLSVSVWINSSYKLTDATCGKGNVLIDRQKLLEEREGKSRLPRVIKYSNIAELTD